MKSNMEIMAEFRKMRAEQEKKAKIKLVFFIISCIVFFPIVFLIVLFAGLAKSEK